MALYMSQREFELLRSFIHDRVGICFPNEKRVILQRKLAARLNRLGLTSFNEYYRYLIYYKEGGLELRQLINTITIDQTAFFRHPEQFEVLGNIVLPEIVTQRNGTKKLRIWSAGCAKGQEAYSISMVVNEMTGGGDAWDVKILASDIDTDVLKFAYRGKYPEEYVQRIPLEYLNRYFERGTGEDSGLFFVKDTLRKKMLFRRLNLCRFDFSIKSPVDVIFCRNVMIYFDTKTTKKLIYNFFNVLKPAGFLFLGISESLFGLDERFVSLGKSVYRKKG